jgi:putative ABC transport system permease protein
VLRDVRFACRLIARQRVFSALVVAVLGFGIGLASTVFAFVDGVLFKPLTMTLTRKPGVESPPHFDRVLRNLAARADVEAVGLTQGPLLDSAMIGYRFPRPGTRTPVLLTELTVTGDYFRALGIPLLAGRPFTENAPGQEMVISRTVQQAYWPGQSPLGQHLRSRDGDFEVVGVVEDSRDIALDHQVAGTFYFPFRESADTTRVTLVARMRVPPAAAGDSLKRDVRASNPDILVSDIVTLQARADRTIAARRFNTALFAVFATAGLALAVVGVYRLVAYSITRRLHEMGIRRALGARGRHVAGAAIVAPLTAASVGIAMGLAAAFWSSGVMRTLLYGVQPTSLWVYTAVGGGLLLATLAASAGPVRRAARVDPMIALRAE